MQTVNPAIFKAYDIRGVYPQEINEDIIFGIGQALVQFSGAKKIVVGRDMRTSSPALAKALIEGITEAGADVADVGLVSTPTFYFAVRHLKAAAGIQVSASHNPKEYNGCKIVLGDEKGIIKVGIESGLAEIRDMVMQNVAAGFSPPRGDLKIAATTGVVEKISGIQQAEIDAAFKLVPLPKEMSTLKIVADPANAMGIPVLTEIFARIPAVNLIKMNFELDGTFPAHQPDPLQPETLQNLQARVRAEHADLGIAPDGDADRVFFLNEKGDIIPASYITAFVAREILSGGQAPALQDRSAAPRVPPKIFYDIRYTWNAKRAIEAYGGTPQVSKVGHAFISRALRDEGGIFAGESSGHYFFRDTGYAEGTPLVILYVLKAMARERKPISEILAPLVVGHESGEINFKLKNREQSGTVIDALKQKYSDGAVSSFDGIAVEYDEWRFSVRASNTEPLLRLNVEGKSKELVEKKVKEITMRII